MALNLAPKAPTGVVRYSWRPPILSGDIIESATLTVTTGAVTITGYEIDDHAVNFFASGGALDETAIIAATVTTAEGETLTDTLYLPIRTTANALGVLVADVLSYALRPIVGLAGAPTAAEQDDARENLDLMLTEWAESGANLGVRLPTQEADVLYVPDGYAGAIKANLRVRLCELYGKPLTAMDVRAARRGEILVKFNNLPEDRAGVYL